MDAIWVNGSWRDDDLVSYLLREAPSGGEARPGMTFRGPIPEDWYEYLMTRWPYPGKR